MICFLELCPLALTSDLTHAASFLVALATPQDSLVLMAGMIVE
jgi:hypothetical protein